ncbi:MAG: PVC-type heme-binding CxxCH protein [Planctomycetaceae bacterium]
MKVAASFFSAVCCSLYLTTLLPAQSPNDDPFALGVRNTEAVTAEEQAKLFTVPEGFRVQLVASEPQIAKPMNLAFDSRGRLWVSSSEEYPFAAAADAVPRDTIRILEDTNGDAIADKVTTFADRLNIPIGLIPYGDGVICFAIPNIWFLRDTDGDNVCDKREVLYGPFDTTRDTHGMCNAFRRGDDGWIYACHGFNNRSEVAGKDGHKVTLTSGNTFRFRPDGSRIELYTQGQVNPFGMSIDRFGDIYTADCHTKPVTLLLPGGCYDSFGRPHDGLGYVPNVMDHLHGSTAIAALALGSDTLFPKEYADNTFDGNVMTSRINRNVLQRRGSSVRAVEQPDLLSCSDPWFRPVDLVAGPDGALYVADFYNRIIGHYEVDLKHPGRDRFRGRIWRVSWTGSRAVKAGPSGYGPDFSHMTTEQLIESLASAPGQGKHIARDVLADRRKDVSRAFLTQQLTSPSAEIRSSAMRLLAQRGELGLSELANAANDSSELLRVHAYKALREMTVPESESSRVSSLLVAGFSDSSSLVRRAAAAAASRHVSASLAAPLLRLLHTTELGDVHLRHQVRIALRDHLLDDRTLQTLGKNSPLTMDAVAISEICLSVKTQAAAEYVASHLNALGTSQPQRLPEYLQFAAAYVTPESAGQVVQAIRQQFAGRTAEQIQLLGSMRQGFAQRNLPVPPAVSEWADETVLQLLQMKSAADLEALNRTPGMSWNYLPHPQSVDPASCWTTTASRRCADGVDGMVLYSSFEAGEKRSGLWRSAAFASPEMLSFYVAGHDGFPDQPLKKANFVRLLDAETGAVLREASPPRNDVAQKVEWKLNDLTGRKVQVELVDGDTATAYAWLAVGRFSLEGLNPSDQLQRMRDATSLIADFRLTQFQPALITMVRTEGMSRNDQAQFAAAIARLRGDSMASAAASILKLSAVNDVLAASVIDVVETGDAATVGKALESAFQLATSSEQQMLAEQLASDVKGAEELARLMENGKASARLLTRPSVQQKLLAISPEPLKQRFLSLTEKLPSEDGIVEKLIADRLKMVSGSKGDITAGKELFKKNCQVCHQLAGEGKQVGPNLDGIANRGLQRMVEDVLAPNRNVDVAFRTTTIVTSEGKALSGLLKELEGGRFLLVDSQAKETILTSDDIDERKLATSSPMPANFGESMTADQFRDLMSFLQTQKNVVVHP